MRWKYWVIGLFLLLVFCDGDDDKSQQYCYDFADGKTLCFKSPLPEGKYCYAEKDESVRCYDQPLQNQ